MKIIQYSLDIGEQLEIHSYVYYFLLVYAIRNFFEVMLKHNKYHHKMWLSWFYKLN